MLVCRQPCRIFDSLDNEFLSFSPRSNGVTPLQALRVATLYPAETLGLDQDLGSIEPGKLADLIVIDGDPLTNIRDLRRVKLVIKDGRVYECGALLR